QRLNESLGFLIAPFPDSDITNHTLLVDQIHRRPKPIAIPVPDRKIVVYGNRKSDVVLLEIARHLIQIVFVGELRGMDANDHESALSILLMPLFDMWLNVPAIVATESPKLDHHDLAFEVTQMDRVTVQPRLADDVRRVHTNSCIRDGPSQKEDSEDRPHHR